MEEPHERDQEQDKRDEFLKLLREYSKSYNVFEPEEQPDAQRTLTNWKEMALLVLGFATPEDTYSPDASQRGALKFLDWSDCSTFNALAHEAP
jgi:hypothetical protein